MEIELIKQDGKIVDVKADGKSIKKSFLNALKKAQETDFWEEKTVSDSYRNPFYGTTFELLPFEASVYVWCIRWYKRYEQGIKTPPVSTYDAMKYLFLELNSEAYFGLIH